MPERFAIYYAPPATGALWEKASTWLGWDAATEERYDGSLAGIERARLLNLTESAVRYGFHATLKAPMALVDGATEADLRVALTAFSEQHAPVEVGPMQLTLLGGFLAIIPAQQNDAVQDFAAHVVENFDVFRAPMSIKDRAARMAKGLSERQEELLDAYGYPYVFEEFQMHMTLTDRLEEADREPITAAARTWFGPLAEEPLTIDSISLFHEAERGRPFRRIADFPLRGQA